MKKIKARVNTRLLAKAEGWPRWVQQAQFGAR
jgi:hypothetical protein